MAQAGKKQISNSKLNMMRKRADFLAARDGVRAKGSALRTEVYPNNSDNHPPRIGLTVTKKNGNAVMRNRIKRRIRAAIICNGTDEMRAAHDYVFISKPNALNAPFDTLRSDARLLIEKSHQRLDEKTARRSQK
ncbi:MAG: ribonuclease P protein component [Pseudomonadota bacterium]